MLERQRPMESFDYIIVGAGAAGCVLAHRLSADPARRVLLLEGGPPDRNPFIHMPKGVGKIRSNSAYMWSYDMFARQGDATPSQQWMRGRTLGGSSAVNGLIYVRGQPQDYQDLAEQTSCDWDWAQMNAAFEALEEHELHASANETGSRPLKVTMYQGDSGDQTLLEAAISAGEQLGLERHIDVNHPDDRPKIGYAQRTIHRGRRQSSSVAFLRPVQHRRNLVVRTGVLVDRAIFEGDKAVAVECRSGRELVRYPGGKIILCAGTLGSPAILQRSGIGAPAHLSQHDLPVVAAIPEVGENLREHTCLNLQWRSTGFSNNHRYRGLGAVYSGMQYYLSRSGPLANAIFEVSALFKTQPELDRPNAQLFFGPHSFTDSSHKTRTAEKEPGFMMCIFPTRPRSTGHVRIVSKDIKVGPRIVFDAFSDSQDRREMIDSVRFARRLAAMKPLANFGIEETRPGAGFQSDQEIFDAYRRLGGPVFHAVGTCRMGSDSESVVDPKTRVRGVRNLHVVDLSIVPRVIASATYGPAMAIAWRAADLLIAQENTYG